MSGKALTSKEQFALSVVEHAIRSLNRGSVTASYVQARAAAAGYGGTARSWSNVLSSLARKGFIEGLADGFVGKTFYVLKEQA